MNCSAKPARLRSGRLALSIFATLIVALFTAPAALAVQTVDGVSYYTTADFCQLTLTPPTASLLTGQTHTVTAHLGSTGVVPEAPSFPQDADVDLDFYSVISGCLGEGEPNPAAFTGADVTFTVTAGPNIGKTGVGAINAGGDATFSYSSAAAGTDTIVASIELPDICLAASNQQQIESADVVPNACLEEEIPVITPRAGSVSTQAVDCGPVLTSAGTPADCPSVVLTANANVTWSVPPTPPTVVAEAADPSISLARFKRCVSRKFKIRPSYSGGQVKTSTLFIDGRKIATKTASTAPFTVNPKRFKAGKHNIEIVTVFTSGKAASKFGSFSRCAARIAARKVTPKFTG
ncbi:MAG: hypothetical protein WAP35_06355 [Solirubrobacterales bacterium]